MSTLGCAPQRVRPGEEVRITGSGWEGLHVVFTIDYGTRAEQYKARIVDEASTDALERGLEVGDIDYTVMAYLPEEDLPRTVTVNAIDAFARVLASASFEVADG